MRTCAIPLNVAIGLDSISVSLMANVSGTPTLLGQGSNSVTVVAGTPFAVTVGINPVVAGTNSISFSTGATLALSYGTPATVTATVVFADPANTPITGSGNVPNFLTPVTITSSDPHVTFNPASLTTPGQTFQIIYDGSQAVASTVTVTVASGARTLATATTQIPGLIITRYNLGAQFTINPEQMTVGSDGNIWVALQVTNQIARIVPSLAPGAPGAVTLFPTGIAGGAPIGIASSSADGLIYYGDNNSCSMGRMNTSGVVQGPIATVAGGGCSLRQMGTDGSGDVWFVDSSHNDVGYMVPAAWPAAGGTCGALPTAFSFSISQSWVFGPDGAMWFTEGGNGHKIGRYASTVACGLQQLTEYTPPSATNHDLGGMVKGADNNLWFTEFNQNLYSRITTAGTVTEYPGIINAALFANLVVITSGSDGQLWIPQGGGAVSFAPATPLQLKTQFFTDNGQTDNHSAIKGPDGDIWISGYGGNSAGFTPTMDEVAKFAPR